MADIKNISDWQLERFALGELDADAARAISARIETDAALRARVDALKASDAEILAAHPAERVLPEIRRRAAWSPAPSARPATTRRWAWTMAMPLAASAAVAALVLIARPHPSTQSSALEDLEEIRIKGAPAHLLAYRMRGTEAEQLRDGARVKPGEAVQLAYRSTGHRFGVVLSIDGRGTVTVHLPEGSGTRAVALTGGAEVTLPNAYELDDAPAFERFIIVTAESPFDAAPVVAAARALAARPDARTSELPLPQGFEQSSLTVQKVQP